MMSMRKLDALVAKEVMGVTFTVDNGEVFIFEDGLSGFSVIFNPSTNIVDAWKVVEKISQNDYRIRIDGVGYGYKVLFFRLGNEHTFKSFKGEGKTAPEAICKAALQVMEDK